MTPVQRRACLVLLMLFISAILPALTTPAAQKSELDRLIAAIESRYGRMKGLAAEFEQRHTAPGQRERRERGRLFLQRPRRMRWEYDPKPGKLFIVNGREVWFYVPADREVTRGTVNNVSDARFPFLFLLGQTNLRREFRSIELLPQGAGGATRWLRLIPRARGTGLREALIETTADGQISKIKLTEESGAVSEFALWNVSENWNAPAGTFEFQPPPGVTIRNLK